MAIDTRYSGYHMLTGSIIYSYQIRTFAAEINLVCYRDSCGFPKRHGLGLSFDIYYPYTRKEI